MDTYEFLEGYGFKGSLSGTNYIAYILEHYKKEEIAKTKIYDELAKHYHETPDNIERTIRYVKSKTVFKDKMNKDFLFELARKYKKK